jgi:hypothetical protein
MLTALVTALMILWCPPTPLYHCDSALWVLDLTTGGLEYGCYDEPTDSPEYLEQMGDDECSGGFLVDNSNYCIDPERVIPLRELIEL